MWLQVLADDVNFGYGRLENLQLLEVDGVRVKSMRHLVQLIGTSRCSSSNSSSSSSGASTSGSQGREGSLGGNWRAVIAEAGQQAQWQQVHQEQSEEQQQQLQEQRRQCQQQQQQQPEEQQTQQQQESEQQRRRQQQARGEQQPRQDQPQVHQGRGEQRYVRFTLERNQVIILDRLEAEQALARILDTHRIPARCSEDLSSEAGQAKTTVAGHEAAALAA